MRFWDFFILLLIYIPLIMIWTFSLLDIFRRDDLSGGWKALWVVVIILLPLIGTLIYLIVRPAGATKEERVAIDEASRAFVQKYSEGATPAEQFKILADLHDAGKLTDEEFSAQKAKIAAA